MAGKGVVAMIRPLIGAGFAIILGIYIHGVVPESDVGITLILIGLLILLGIFVKIVYSLK